MVFLGLKGDLKSKVFEVDGRPQNMADMKAKITRVINELEPDIVKRVVFDVRSRAQRVIAANGVYIEK